MRGTKRSGPNQIVGQQPLKQTTEAALGPRYAVGVTSVKTYVYTVLSYNTHVEDLHQHHLITGRASPNKLGMSDGLCYVSDGLSSRWEIGTYSTCTKGKHLIYTHCTCLQSHPTQKKSGKMNKTHDTESQESKQDSLSE